MSSKREQIVQAAADAFAGTVDVGTRIFRSRLEAFQRAESPAVVVEPGVDEASGPSASNCYIDWNLTLVIGVYARGHVPDQVADPVVSDIHSRLMADRTLGGLAMDVWPVSHDPQFEKADRPAVWTVLTYRVRYRTSTTSIDS